MLFIFRLWRFLLRRFGKYGNNPFDPTVPGKEWSNEFLAAKRQRMDPAADRVIEYIMTHDGRDTMNQLFHQLTRNTSEDYTSYPPIVAEFFVNTTSVPDWVKKRKMLRGQRVFKDFGPSMSMVLLCKALPSSYACADGALVLYETGRLHMKDGSLDAFKFRLVETSQFVLDVMRRGGLGRTGKGVVTAQKIRLIHATIRYQLKQKGWNSEKLGEPINQEDMAGTLMAFSALVLEGMRTLNAGLTEKEERHYYYCWRAIGHLMGVDEDLIPEKLEDGYSLGQAILKRNMRPSEWGTILTQACIEFIESMMPKRMYDGLGAGMVAYLVGEEIASVLQIEVDSEIKEKRITKGLKELMPTSGKFRDNMPLAERLFGVGNRLLMSGMIRHMNDKKKIRFEIPEDLAEEWNLPEMQDQDTMA